MNSVIAEGLTLFDTPFSDAAEREFIRSLGPRSVLHVARFGGVVAGVQSLDRYSTLSESLAHVATMGTWLMVEARGTGMGRALAEASFSFARAQGYLKIVIHVLARNHRALRFYRQLGFTDIGVARRHVRLAGEFHDELYLEKSL